MKKVLLFFLILIGVFFYRSVFFGEIPMPGDHIIGVYYPWLDYKWPGFPTGVPVKNPLLADVPSLFYPLKIFSMGLFKSGIFPSWNPLIFNGYPLLATFQSGVLNPFNFWFLIFNNSVAWTLFIATQPFLALLFMYFFLRVLNLNKISAVLGSVVYAFCGFNLLWLEYGIHGFVAAYIPLLFLLVYQKKYLLTAVIFAAQLFSGYPQISLYTIIFLGIWVLWLDKKLTLSCIFKYILSVLLGLGLAGMLLVPGFELFRLSQRVGEPLSGGKTGAYYPVKQLITLLAPDFYGNPTTYNVWGGVQYTNNTGYASVIALVLGLAALVLSRRRHLYFFTFLYLLPVILSLPSPLSYIIQKLPLFSASVMTRIMVFSGFALAVLAGFGLDSLSRFKPFRFSQLKLLVLPIFILIGFAAVAFFHSGPEKMIAFRNLFFPVLFIIIALVSIGLLASKLKIKNLALVIILFSVTAELFRFGWKYNAFFPAALIFPPTKVTDYLKAQAGYRIDGGDTLPLSVWMAYGLQSGSGYDAVYPGTWSQYLSAIDYGNISHPKGRLGDVSNYSSPLFDLSGTGYLLALKRNQEGLPDPKGVPFPRFNLPKLTPVFTDGTVVIYKNNLALPKYSLKTGYEILTDKNQIISRLQDPQFITSGKVILEQDPQFHPVSGAPGLLSVVSEIPGREILQVSVPKPAFLLNTQSFYPGWQATVDNRPAPVLKTDFAFQSVAVPAGVHTVEFTYRPLSLTIGACTSVISAILILVISTFFRRRFA
jgi:hypothetical protein